MHLLNVLAGTVRKTRGIFIDVRLAGTIATRNPYVCRYSPTNVGVALDTFSNRAGSAEGPTRRACTVRLVFTKRLRCKDFWGCSTGIAQKVRGAYTFDLTLVTRFYSIQRLFPNHHGVRHHGTCPPFERDTRALERASERALGARRSGHHSAGPA